MNLFKIISLLLILSFSGVVLYWGLTTEYGSLVSIPHFIVAGILFGSAIMLLFLKVKWLTKVDRMKRFEKIRTNGMLLFVLKFGFLYFSIPMNLVIAALDTEKLRYQSLSEFLIDTVILTISIGILMGWIFWLQLAGDYEEYTRESGEIDG